jgi:Family of unknown function (DUF6356)
MPIRRLFTGHPCSVGETYLTHFRVAVGFGSRMMVAGLACIVHALLPFLFERTGSRCIDQLHERMVVSRSRRRLTLPGELGRR